MRNFTRAGFLSAHLEYYAWVIGLRKYCHMCDVICWGWQHRKCQCFSSMLYGWGKRK